MTTLENQIDAIEQRLEQLKAEKNFAELEAVKTKELEPLLELKKKRERYRHSDLLGMLFGAL